MVLQRLTLCSFGPACWQEEETAEGTETQRQDMREREGQDHSAGCSILPVIKVEEEPVGQEVQPEWT